MITLQVPYYYIDSLYVTGIVALFIMFIMFSKILLLLKENRSLRTLCRNQQEYCNKINPDKILNYFGIDIIKISLPKNLKNLSTDLMAKIVGLREELADNLGYIIPNVRICNDYDLKKDEYEIFVRTKSIKKFKIEEEHEILDQIIENLKTICLENISKIFLQENAQKLLDEVSNKKIVETLLQNLSVEDIRLILIELINQKISIKDNNYVMERMSVYACKPTLIEIVTALKNDLN